MEYLNVALAKGRLAELSMEFFANSGIHCSEFNESHRKLVLYDETQTVRFFLGKPSDIPTFVEYGAADLGIVGKDTLLEEDRDLFEVLDLGIAACKICVAGPNEIASAWSSIPRKRIATKYPHIAQEYFQNERKERVEVIKINGSVELGPIVGLADVIVDIVQSGSTLKANGLSVFEDIAEISGRLVVNRVSMKTKAQRIIPLIENFKNQVLKGNK
ncbi:MAG: ATP phosphoribosyltransferase [Bacillota bacterium]|nr:ATP phosphoribosyltransferase [Bacillota bacterium]